MKKPITLFTLMGIVLLICVWALWPKDNHVGRNDSLTLYCAAGLRVPVSEIISNYEQDTGHSVKVIYNGSGALLSQLKIGGGDLYLPAHADYITEAEKQSLIADAFPAVQLTAVIVVHKDNASIQSLDDLTRPGVRISMADESAAIGRHTRKVLDQLNMLESVEKNVTVTKPTVNNIIEDVVLGSVDATIAWDAVARNYPDIKTIRVEAFTRCSSRTSIALLRASRAPTPALDFARYLTAPDKGLEVFRQHQFQIPESDTPAALPSVDNNRPTSP